MKACLVDFTSKGLVVPWMVFPNAEAAVAARKEAHSSWPNYVAEINDKPTCIVRGRTRYSRENAYRLAGRMFFFLDHLR